MTKSNTPPPFVVSLGDRFGKLVVIELTDERIRGYRVYRCQCDCGNTKLLPTQALRTGTQSCGCIASRRASEQLSAQNLKHGMCDSPTYRSWANMRSRCHNPNDHGYPRYGGRGIRTCERWDSFENFLMDMGEKPEWATGGLDRIDGNGNYEPGNCRWATWEQQAVNRRMPNEIPRTIAESILRDRMDNGMTYAALAEKYDVSFMSARRYANGFIPARLRQNPTILSLRPPTTPVLPPPTSGTR